MIQHGVGVVVIGRNEGERLVACLSSVKATAGDVVYVDSGSTDGSVTFARQIGAHVVLLDLSRPFSAARARNEGFAALKALRPDIRFVQFVDGDCVLISGWIESAVSFAEQRTDVAIVCGRRRELHPTASIYNQLFDLEWNTPVGETPACGGDALVRAEAFEAAGGFCPGVMAGEEPELCIRLREKGWKIWRIDAEMTQHDAAMTRFGQWWLRSVRTGYGCAQVSRLHRKSPFRLWKRAIPSAIFWGNVLPTAIILGAVMHPLLLWGVLIYPLQACKIAVRGQANSMLAWAYGAFTVLGKFPQSLGIIKFYLRQSLGLTPQLIEYKTSVWS
jgi:GT2 family glycosyltransferase